MTTALEHLQSATTDRTHGDSALEIVDAYRGDVDDHFRVEQLEVEFPSLARQLGTSANNVFVAHAADNIVGAYKWRGALVGAVHLQENGMAAFSAKNHGAGAIFAAKALGMKLSLVVPRSISPSMLSLFKELGGGVDMTLHVIGNTVDESAEWAKSHPELGPLLHPFDDEYVGSGQGTMADDIQSWLPEAKHIAMAFGGGGGAAGVVRRYQSLGRDDIIMHAIEAPGSNSMSRSIAGNQLAAAEQPNQRYSGSAVGKVGAYAFATWRDFPNNLRVDSDVTEHDVDILIADYAQDRHDNWRDSTPAFEPTTLVAVAAIKRIVQEYPGEAVVVIGTGQNAPLYPTENNRQPHYLFKRQK